MKTWPSVSPIYKGHGQLMMAMFWTFEWKRGRLRLCMHDGYVIISTSVCLQFITCFRKSKHFITFSKGKESTRPRGPRDFGQLSWVHMVESHNSKQDKTSLKHRVIPIRSVMVPYSMYGDGTRTMSFIHTKEDVLLN